MGIIRLESQMSITNFNLATPEVPAYVQPTTLNSLQSFSEKIMGYFKYENDSYNKTSHSGHYTKPTEPTDVTHWGLTTDPQKNGTFTNLIQAHGLHCESHNVTTDDGYILTLFRVRDPEGPKFDKGAKPILVQHGLTSDSNTWILLGAESLSVKLAHAGYDVWFGNNRGTRYSRGHLRLDPVKNSADRKEYYDYSFYELGKYDLTANVDYIRKQTGFDKITYMGHSQGTSQMFSALSENHGSMNDKIDTFVAMAPIVNLFHQQGGIQRDVSTQWRKIITVSNVLNIHSLSCPMSN